MGCDGIFDKLSNGDVIHSIWSMSNDLCAGKDINEHCGKISDVIIRNCLGLDANDNLTCIFICFENFKNVLYQENKLSLDHDKLNKIFDNLKNLNHINIKEKDDEMGENINIRGNTPKKK